MKPIKSIVSYILLGNYTIVSKIAFYINEEYIFDHYHNVMMRLNSNNFDVVLADKFKDEKYKPIIDRLTSYSWNVVFLNDVLYVKKYKVLVTHLYLGGNTTHSGTVFSRLSVVSSEIIDKLIKAVGLSVFKEPTKQYFQNILGLYNIRFMYGADAGGVKFGEYNQLFDMFFCHGPRDANIIKDKFKKPVFEMGYPRYDNYFKNIDNENLKKTILKKYSCNNNKVTVLWICTVSEYFSTIETYAKSIQNITDKYNVILRPHPLEIDPQYSRYNQKVFDIVNSGFCVINSDPCQDMSELYLIADYVFCDYGGTVFSALYVEKNILLMNHKNVHMDDGVFSSTSMEIREFLPSINETDTDRIVEYLSDPKFWIEAKQKRKEARIHYFGSSKGNSSKLAVDKFMSILNSV
ncbi:MAG: hypothetical protein HOL23_06250 [Gammaproteobacteria bacterium]|jgi:hypothetical protein|nr:hypothetical protein [Gammaproteobacteria bacterium]